MRRRGSDLTRLLSWYPDKWRERYGDEFSALIQDSLGSARPSLRLRLSTAWSGLREHGYQNGLLGDQQSAPRRLRAASLLVLCSWTAFVLAGASYAKLAEHFAAAMPVDSRSLATNSFDAVSVLGTVGIVIVLLGAGFATPTFVRHLQHNGWTSIRRPVVSASVATLVTMSSVLAIKDWAHHLNAAQRNGGSGTYSLAFVAFVLCVVATLTLWTRVVSSIALRLDFSRSVLRAEALLACILSGVMIAITLATAVWWQAIGTNAPWFMQGTRFGTAASPFSLNIILTMALMVVAGVTSITGVSRIAHTWREV